MFKPGGKKVLPSLVTLELVGSSQDVAESSSWLEVQKTFHLQTQSQTVSNLGLESCAHVWWQRYKGDVPAAWWEEDCWHVDRTPPPGTGAAGPPGWTKTCWWGAQPGCTERTTTQRERVKERTLQITLQWAYRWPACSLMLKIGGSFIIQGDCGL